MENPDTATVDVDYTQVFGNRYLLENVFKFLPDDTDLARVAQVSRSHRAEVALETRRRILQKILQKLLTYGAVAVREGHEDDENILRNILRDQDNWNTSRDALTFVARTFSGAKHDPDGPYKLDNLYPANPDSKLAFRMVHQWWNWMCDHNRSIAIQTDLLSFFLFAGENWKEKNSQEYQEQLRSEENYDSQLGEVEVDDWGDHYTLSNNGDGTTYVMEAQFYKADGNFDVIARKTMVIRTGYPEQEYSFSLRCSANYVLLTNGPEQDTHHTIFGGEPGEPFKFRIDKNSTALWAHACVDELRVTTNIESIPVLPQRANLKTLHATRADRFARYTDEDTHVRVRPMFILF